MDVKRSWTCTLVTQLCLCVALYLALNIGEPQQQQPWQRLPRRPDDVIVFVTVRGGGFRPFQTQTHLLKQIEDVVRIYGARFVVNFSELGEEDPLTRNASQLFKSPSIPWYTTKASKGQEIASCFKEHIKIDNRQTFNMIGLNTGSLLDLLLTESMNGSGDGQNWLGSTLEAANGSIWSIVVGYHPIIRCDKNHEHLESINSAPEILHHIFVKYGVNAYLSTNACSNHTSRDGVDYIGIAGPDEHSDGPFLPNRKLGLDQQQQNGMADGFLLHRVTSLEMITYSTSSEGKVLSRFVTQQKGKAGI
ncbi:unnamed protein product [Linum tenue]|uniref:Uncharacterized protein n=1 Tax=Linum tenue TaxID=586396 RepID=A0AAV0QE16_9ROSI|nr:unnamed protein product [Linum tenue]